MPRFSAAFSRRKSTADDVQNALMSNPEQSSFRVIERTDLAGGKSFDGGARLARASATPMTRPNHLETEHDDNMFANLKGDRGSGVSNFTKATSTDNSSRHSNASTAPSSADMGAAPDNSSKRNLHEVSGRRGVTSSGSNFLSKAGRTFSFGTKKAPAPSSPDVPPIPTIQREDETGRARGLTSSTIDTQTTTTPPRLGEGGGAMDLGGDFGNMFSGSGFDKRASTVTLKNTLGGSPQTTRQKQPTTLHLDSTSNVESGPLSWNSEHSNDGLLGSRSPPLGEQGPPVPRHQPRHQPSFETKSADHSPEVPDEEAKLLQDTLAAARFISTVNEEGAPPPPVHRHRSEQESFSVIPRKAYPSAAASQEDNMFAGSPSRFARQPNRQPARNPNAAPQNKVMTPEEFERYRRHKEQLGTAPGSKSPVVAHEDEDEDEINYDDDEDDAEKSKQQAKQRRKQEAHMAVYRQQMMKVTGEPTPAPPVTSSRPNLPTSLSAPHLANFKSPSPDSAATDEDDDEEVPLAILQAHGFPHKNRAPSRLNAAASNPNLRAASQASARPGSSLGEPTTAERQRHSTLPAFARGLPQDPFVGASVSRPAVRESLHYGGGAPAPQMPQQIPQQNALPPGGLVGVIANEERSRAMRRGSPNMEARNFQPSPNFQGNGMDPMASMPPQMMYNQGGMGGMPQMPQMTAGDQAQMQMNQQMTQFMQMQMQFMQMMAANGQGGQPQMPPQMGQMGQMGMQGPYMGGAATQSQADLSGRQSVMGDFEPPRMNSGMRTMSMVQPHTGFGPSPGYAPSFHSPAPGYTPSIAPSERSNIGLPGRYRPVSQAPASIVNQHGRSNTMSGALSTFGEEKKKSSMNIVNKSGAGSDDDDDEGWEAMKAKREKKRTLWRNKKDFAGILDAVS